MHEKSSLSKQQFQILLKDSTVRIFHEVKKIYGAMAVKVFFNFTVQVEATKPTAMAVHHYPNGLSDNNSPSLKITLRQNS